MLKFWMVWKEGGRNSPSHKHASIDAARREAARLCQLDGGKFIVLEAVEACQPTPQVEWLSITIGNDIPF